jgi:tetratricopeptide (TPR) repeat protein
MPDEAAGAYKKAIKNNPGDAAALSVLGCLYAERGENPEICELFCRQSVEISPEEGLYHHRLGKLYLKHNQLTKALQAFQKAGKLGFDAQKDIQEVQRLLVD